MTKSEHQTLPRSQESLDFDHGVGFRRLVEAFHDREAGNDVLVDLLEDILAGGLDRQPRLVVVVHPRGIGPKNDPVIGILFDELVQLRGLFLKYHIL